MKGNFHVRFLEEGERVTALLYSAIFTDPWASVSRNFGLRSVGVCFAYPLFDKPFSKVFIHAIRVLFHDFSLNR